VRYQFEMRHEGSLCDEGDQSAVWMRVSESDGAPAASGAGLQASDGAGA
jgi:hypothetical protein